MVSPKAPPPNIVALDWLGPHGAWVSNAWTGFNTLTHITVVYVQRLEACLAASASWPQLRKFCIRARRLVPQNDPIERLTDSSRGFIHSLQTEKMPALQTKASHCLALLNLQSNSAVIN